MHEFSLYGTVAQDERERVLQQLAGVARMQPQVVKEVHMIFRAKAPPGLANLPSAGGSQGVMQQDIQRVKNMLNASLYYVQLVGTLTEGPVSTNAVGNEDIIMLDEAAETELDRSQVQWVLEFKDTPDPGKQSVSSRLISRTPLESGNPVQFLEKFGYEYVSQYYLRGYKFYDQDTTLFLYEILQSPQTEQTASSVADISKIPAFSGLQSIDPGRQYLLQASVDVADGNHPDLKERATSQLLSMKNTLRQMVKLGLGDRLALDTKVPLGPRRL